MSRLESLRKLETTLENFLLVTVDRKAVHMDRLSSLDMLNDIARDSLKGRTINTRLGDWFAQNRPKLDSKLFKRDELTQVGNLLEDIKKGLDDNIPETNKLAGEIENWRNHGVVPNRKLILKLKPKSEDKEILAVYTAILGRQTKQLESGEYDGWHMLTVLDDVLKSAAAKEDEAYLHLAASMIYYLKMKGYKISPFVRRLRDIEGKKSLGGGRV